GELARSDNFLPKDRITIISNGVDVQGKFNPNNIVDETKNNIRSGLNLNEKDFVVTFIGRLVEEKGILDLLEAMNKITDRNIKLVVIGSTGSSERDQSMNHRLDAYKENPNIIFTGFRSDIPELLSITDVFCLPSYREGMPRSIIEAMAMECAVVATNIRGSREEVDDGKNGYLVDLNDPDSIADKIYLLKENKLQLELYKENAREKAERLYNEKDVVMKQLEIFSSLRGE